MLEIGLPGLALALTLTLIGALKKGGKSLPTPAALAVGIVLAYTYARVGEPFSILSDKGAEATAQFGGEFGAVPAAVALGLGGLWHYLRPGPVLSTLFGFLIMTAAAAATGFMAKAESILGSLITVFAG